MAEWEGFEKLGRLGVGATGTVWLARQLSVDRAVALKELAPEIAGDVVVCERLRREAQLLARLDDPNCVAVYSFLESGTAAALVMEYVDGVSLSTLSAAGRLNIEQALAVLEGALSGLAHAHGRGIVHGDLKPENILLASNGQSKLVDFGLAAAVGTVRAPGIGSPTYLSPEAAAGGPLGVTSDLYSMALVLSELVAGTLLPGTDPATAAAAVPSPIAGLVRHALDPDPAARPQSAGDFLATLRRRGGGGLWLRLATPGRPRPPRRGRSRRRGQCTRGSQGRGDDAGGGPHRCRRTHRIQDGPHLPRPSLGHRGHRRHGRGCRRRCRPGRRWGKLRPRRE